MLARVNLYITLEQQQQLLDKHAMKHEEKRMCDANKDALNAWHCQSKSSFTQSFDSMFTYAHSELSYCTLKDYRNPHNF
jgi:hypothetical protein